VQSAKYPLGTLSLKLPIPLASALPPAVTSPAKVQSCPKLTVEAPALV